METLPDLVARDRRTDAEALLADDQRRQTYTYHRFCTTAWKAGNFLRHLGVRDGTTVAIATDRGTQPILAVFGTALLGGIVRLDPPRAVDARAVIAHVDDVERYELPDGGQRAGYGGEPAAAGTYHFEEEVWSENPTRVPREYDPDDSVLDDGSRTYSHADLLAGAEVAVDRLGIEAGDRVRVDGRLGDPRVLAAGVLAPLSVGAVSVLSEGYEVDATVYGPRSDGSEGTEPAEQTHSGHTDDDRTFDATELSL